MSNKNISAEELAKLQTLPTESDMKRLRLYAQEQVDLESEIDDVLVKLDTLKVKLKRLTEETIPELMTACGIELIALDSGVKVSVKPFYAAKIPDEKKPEAFKWLRKHGHDGIIKSEVTSRFNRGEQHEMRAVIRVLRENKFPYEQKDSVHHSTLKAFVRDAIESGEQIPTDLFGVHIGRRSKLEIPKE